MAAAIAEDETSDDGGEGSARYGSAVLEASDSSSSDDEGGGDGDGGGGGGDGLADDDDEGADLIDQHPQEIPDRVLAFLPGPTARQRRAVKRESKKPHRDRDTVVDGSSMAAVRARIMQLFRIY